MRGKKILVGVMMGGSSIEREVSFNSGRTVCDHLDPEKFLVVPIFQKTNGSLFILPWKFLYRGTIQDFEQKLEQNSEQIYWKNLKNHIDFLYLALHGSGAEDGAVQAMCNLYNIPFSGSNLFAAALTSDKRLHDRWLSMKGIETPPSIFLSFIDSENEETLRSNIMIKNFIDKIGFPIVVKPQSEGSSFGISIVDSYEKLFSKILLSQSINPYKRQGTLLQKKLKGIEFSCVLLETKSGWLALEPTEILHSNNDYHFNYHDKYMPGAAKKRTPISCNRYIINEIQNTCKKTAEAVEGKGILRIDGFYCDDSIYIIDTNIFPGTGPSSFTFEQAACSELSHTKVINMVIESSICSSSPESIFFDTISNNKAKFDSKKMRIAVLLGGQTSEREISLESGRNVCYKLSTQEKYEIIPLFVSSKNKIYRISQRELVKHSTLEIENSINKENFVEWEDLPLICNFVFIALHGGFGENGQLQGVLETLFLPYNGSGIATSALCMDKYKTNEFLKKIGFAVPNHILLPINNDALDKKNIEHIMLEGNIEFPCISKPHDDGCSTLVQRCKNIDEIITAITLAKNFGKKFLFIEECIDGDELTIGVIGEGNKKIVLPPSLVKKKSSILSLEEKFLPGDGENITPAPIGEDNINFVQKIIGKIYDELGCFGYARIDCFLRMIDGKKELIFLECNTLPALTPATCFFHQASEIALRPINVMEKIIEEGLKRNYKKIN